MSISLSVTKMIRQARAEIDEEETKKVVAALKTKYRQLKSAEAIVKNLEREIADMEASLEDGSFVA